MNYQEYWLSLSDVDHKFKGRVHIFLGFGETGEIQSVDTWVIVEVEIITDQFSREKSYGLANSFLFVWQSTAKHHILLSVMDQLGFDYIIFSRFEDVQFQKVDILL